MRNVKKKVDWEKGEPIFLLERMSWRPTVDFTNILLEAFKRADPKAQKIQSNYQYFLCFRDLLA